MVEDSCDAIICEQSLTSPNLVLGTVLQVYGVPRFGTRQRSGDISSRGGTDRQARPGMSVRKNAQINLPTHWVTAISAWTYQQY